LEDGILVQVRRRFRQPRDDATDRALERPAAADLQHRLHGGLHSVQAFLHERDGLSRGQVASLERRLDLVGAFAAVA
jgi:hypothetical protein